MLWKHISKKKHSLVYHNYDVKTQKFVSNNYVTNLVASHHSTTAHHPWTTTPIMHCTTTHTFPSTIAPITSNPDCLTTPAPHSHTHTFKQHSYMHSLRSLVLPWLTFPSGFPSVSICVLPGLLTLSPDRLLPAYWLASLSAACPDPLLCLWLRICLVYIALDTSVWYLPVWPPLCINKAAAGSQRHWSVITNYDSNVLFGIIQLNCSLLYIILFTLVGFMLADRRVVCLQNNVKNNYNENTNTN